MQSTFPGIPHLSPDCTCSMLPQHKCQRHHLQCNRQEAYLLVLSCVNLAIARSKRCSS